jgi:hypothetical protein
VSDFHAKRTRLMRADAALREIELGRRRGGLLTVETATDIYIDAMRRVREKTLSAVGGPHAEGSKPHPTRIGSSSSRSVSMTAHQPSTTVFTTVR